MIRFSKLISLALIAFMFAQCASAPKYVPAKEMITSSVYGSYVVIKNIKNETFKGELLAVDDEKVIMLTHDNDQFEVIEEKIIAIKDFTLRFAQPTDYSWSIPTSFLLSFSHGWFAILSAPVNIFITSSVAASGSSSFTYDKKQVSVEDLAKFARFPQGFPPNLSYERIEEDNYKEFGTLVSIKDAGLNGDFETTVDNEPVNWFLRSGSDRNTIKVISTKPKSGDKCLVFKHHEFKNLKASQPAITQIVAVHPNHNYRVKFYAKSKNMTLELRLGNPSSPNDKPLQMLQTKGNKDGWTLYETVFKTIEQQEALRIEIAGITNGEAFLDLLSLTELK